MDARTRNGILFAFLMMGGYAFLPTFTKLVYRYSDLRGIDIAAWRFATALPMIWAIIYLRGRLRGTNANTEDNNVPRLKLLLLGVGLAAGALAAFYGLSYIDASIYIILFRTQPIMVIVINALLGERLPLRGWIALLVVTAGVLLVLEPGNVAGIAANMDRAYAIGIAIALFNALAIALYNIGQQHFMTGYKAKMRAAAWTVTGTLLTLIPGVLVLGLQVPPNWQTYGALLGLAVMTTVIPTAALYEAIDRLGASRLVIVASLEPLLAVSLAIVLLGEPMLGWVQILGGALILSSVFILQARQIRWQAPRPQQAVAAGD